MTPMLKMVDFVDSLEFAGLTQKLSENVSLVIFLLSNDR